MNKLKFAGLHLLISASIVITFLFFSYTFWYGNIYYDISGAWVPSKMLLMIDVILGPLLSFIIYKKGKKNLKVDLFIIGLIQIFAFIYGAYTLFLGKPSLVVLKQNTFEIIIEKEVDKEKINHFAGTPTWLSRPQYGYIPEEELSQFQSALVQQEHIQPFDFKMALAAERKISLEQVKVFLRTDLTKLNDQIGKTEKLNFYLVNDKDWYALMVADSIGPVKIIKSSNNNSL